MIAPPPATTIQLQLDAIQMFFENKSTKTIKFTSHPAISAVKDLFKALGAFSIELKSELINLSKEDAKIIISGFGGFKTQIPKLEKQLNAFIPVTQGEIEILQLLKLNLSNLKEIIEEINFIAHSPEVDETSDDYNNFLGEMMAKEINDPNRTRTFGTKNLFALLED